MKYVIHIDTVLKCVCQANMRVAPEKNQFFKESVEFFGFYCYIKRDQNRPGKGKKNLISFLGLFEYYKRFK